ILGQATAARWDLHGLALPWDAATLDRDPGPADGRSADGEWTLRHTLGHVVSTQASYTVRTIYAVHRLRHEPGSPVTAPDERYRRLSPDEVAVGSVFDVRERLDDWMDAGIAWLASVDDPAELAAPTTWTGYAVDAAFRLLRWSSHIREHTVQLEKTLVMLGTRPREVDRLLRLVAGAFGGPEGDALGAGAPADAILRDAAGVADATAAEVAGDAAWRPYPGGAGPPLLGRGAVVLL